jgi:hypothetical protein
MHTGEGPWLDHLLDDNAAEASTAGNPPVTHMVAAAQPSAAQPVDIGQFGPLQQWPIEWINAVMLPTGKVLGYDRTLNLTLWDPVTNTFTTPASPGYNFFCTGTSLLSDGDVLMVGGAVVDTVGLPYAAIYNPFTDSWTQLGNMNAGRWYPAVTTMANGDALVLSGDANGNVTNPLPQVYDSTTGTWRDLTGAVQSLPVYPRTFSAPNGDAFVAGPQALTEYIDTSGVGSITPVGLRIDPDRNFGSAVMYAPGKVLYVGGGSPATNSAEVIDLNAPNPAWRQIAPMAYARRNCNATLLPDGEVLVNGGNDGSGTYDGNDIMAAEIWNPTTETFRTVANAADIRWYHSTSLLLPDGRVITTSGDSHLTGEVYSPPYLFEGPQPTITSAPGTVLYGDNFFVGTPDAASITSVRWIRLGTATHAQNWDQYMQSANFSVSADGTGLNVSAPPTADASPPGYYYLFILKGDVPSVAKIIKVGTDLPAVSVTGTSVTEGTAGSTVNATFTVTLAQSSAKSVTVNYATADGTALAGTNYLAQTGTVTFPPLSTTQTITVPIINDGVLDPNLLFTVNLSAPVNAAVGIGMAQGLIRDHDALPVLDIAGATIVKQDSGTPPANFVVTLSSPSATTVTVAFTTADGTATAPRDYVAQSGTLTFAPGVTQQTVSVGVVSDGTYDPNKTFFVNLSAPVGATLDIPQAQALVYNNDPPPSANLQGPATFTEPPAGVTENVTLTATLSAPTEKTVRVPWTTAADGTAVAGVNFVDQNGVVTFPPGVTSQTFTVQVIGDGVKTANPTFSVQMQSEVQNAVYGNRYTGVTLIDSDTLPAVDLADTSVTEVNAATTSAVFTATLTAPMTQPVTVNYATSAGTATPGVNYVETTGILTFAPGVTSQTVSVPVIGNTMPESDTTFNLTLSNPVNCQLDIDKVVGTIIDDNGAPVPPTPTGLNAVAGFGIVQLTWDAMPGATSYDIYRGTNDSGEGTTPIATGIVGTTYTDTGLVNRQDYYYRVSAVNTPQPGTSFESQQSAEFAISPTPYDFSQGFPGTNVDPTVAKAQYLSTARSVLSLNGLNVQDTRTFNNSLQLTDGGTQETDSAFTLLPVNVNRFSTQFTYQATPSYLYTGPLADGITFTIQGVGPTVLGDSGGGLGYAGIGQSVALKFDLFNNLGEGDDSTGIYTNGVGPAVPAIDLTGTGIDLKDGDWFNIGMVYDGTTLVATITDTVTQAVATQSYTINIPAIVGGNTAYVGFTGATGGLGAVQKIRTWTYTPGPSAPTNLQVRSASATQVSLNWTNTDPNATSVLIERKTGLNGTYAQIGTTTTAAANTDTDLAVSPGTTYYYRVRAVNNGSTSVYSNEVNVTTQSAAVPADLKITNTDGVTTIVQGAAVKYTIVVTNSGPSNVTGATVTDTFASTLSAITYTATATGGATGFTTSGTGNINDTVTMPSGSTITYVAKGTLSGSATGSLLNTAAVTAPAGVTDTNPANNSVTDTDTILPIINFPSGFTGSTSSFHFNGASAKIVGANLQLTDGGTGEAASIYYATQVNVTRFNTSFNMQVTPASTNTADGMTFILQNAGVTKVGASGGGLGSSGIGKSVEVKFDLYNNSGEGPNSTGLYLNGANPTATNSINLNGTGINLHSGHVFNVGMTYDGTKLQVTITDTVTAAKATQSYTVNIPATVGANTAYVGFTGATGGRTSTQKILNWTYVVTSATTTASKVASSAASSPAIPVAAPVKVSAMSATQARSLVAAIYRDILGHAPDAVSWDRIAGQLQSGASVQSVAESLLTSPEHDRQVVDGFYATYFKQTTNVSSNNTWVQALEHGISADQVATDFLLSSEYAKLHAHNADFISSLYQNVLGRPADANGLANFVSALAAGQTRAAVVTSFLTSPERYRHIVDQLFEELFQHRADPTSLQLYSSQLQSGTYAPDSLELTLIGSDKFFKLNRKN